MDSQLSLKGDLTKHRLFGISSLYMEGIEGLISAKQWSSESSKSKEIL